MDISQHAVQMW